jgi:hypothetical protein
MGFRFLHDLPFVPDMPRCAQCGSTFGIQAGFIELCVIFTVYLFICIRGLTSMCSYPAKQTKIIFQQNKRKQLLFPSRNINLLFFGDHTSHRPRRGSDHPPQSSAEVKERVGLYLYSPSGPLLCVLGQCFSTAGPRPVTGPWHQLYRAREVNIL